VPLPVFTSSRSIPQPNWGYGVVKKDLRRLQPLCEVVQWLLHGGVICTDLLWTFFSHRVQPLYQWEMTMWMCPGTSCPDHPFSEEWVIWRPTPGFMGSLLLGPF
jgi:hypothetical protein